MQGLVEFIQSLTVPKVAGRIGSTYLPLDLAWAGDTIPGYPRKVGERSLPSAAPYEMGYFSSFPFCYICSIPVIFSISISICQRYPPYSITLPTIELHCRIQYCIIHSTAMESKTSTLDEAQRTPSSNTANRSPWLASAFGGSKVTIGPRVEPLAEHLASNLVSETDSTSAVDLHDKQVASEAGNAIQYRTCSWQKTAGLLFSEYIVLSIMSFPWSYSLLGLVPGLILTAVVAGLVLYTSLVLWEFCLRHPEVRDVCDIGQMIWWNGRWAWWWTAAMFVLNNTFIQALHVLVGAIYLNTMTEADNIKGCRTVAFAVVVTVISWIGSLPRTFSMLSKLAFASTLFTFVSVILATAFSGAQGKPAGYPSKGEPIISIWTPSSTTLVTGMSAFMNMSYTFIGQTTIPSFIAEMRDPR